MAFIHTNPNPHGSYVGDCVIRALSIALDKTWYETYLDLCIQGLMLCDMPSSNRVWDEYLKNKGYQRYIVPGDCPNCYSVRDFSRDNNQGRYILGTGSHVVTVINGDYYDSWDSGDENPIFYWYKEE